MALSLDPSYNTCLFKYNVFLSEANRNTFTDHLYKALLDKRIETFIDDKLNRGDEISLSLLQAIEESLISVFIFSEGYVSSRKCLEELVKILVRRQNHRQIEIPVFYEIYPSRVRLQRWKDALKEAANLSGFDSHSSVYKNECELTEAIVQDVLKRLNDKLPSTDSSSYRSEISNDELLLCLRSEDVRSVGIYGIGGLGKATLARAVFKNEEIEHQCGLNRLRQELWLESALESDHGGNVLHLASDQGKCKLLSACPKSIEEPTSEQETVFHVVVRRSDPNVFKVLFEEAKNLRKDYLLDRRDCKGNNQLHCAVLKNQLRVSSVITGRVDLVRELLFGPESVMLVSAKEETPLRAAIRRWQENFLELLIESIQKRRDYVHLINKKDCADNRQQFQTIRLLPSDKPSCNGKVDVNALNDGGFTDLDFLDVFPHERIGDRESRMILQRGGALRARDSGKVKLDFSNNVKSIESQRNRDQSSHLQANWPMKTKHKTTRDAYHVLLITTAVILAITFHAALNAPGKLVDNIKYKSSSSLGFQVGKQSSNYLLRLFIWFDSIAFITSAASMIIILMHEIPLKPWMLISVLSIYGAYICLIIAVSPRDALPVFLLGSPTILLASMSKHLALHSTLLKLLQFLWVRVYKK